MAKPSVRAFLWVFPIVLVCALVVLAMGAVVASRPGPADYTLLAAGCISVFAVLAVWCLALVMLANQQSQQSRLEELMSPVNERLQQINVLLNMVSEQQLISERAKAIAFRDTERDALRRAIREEIAKKDYEAALVLANDIERVFGYKQEADRFREEITKLRQDELRKQMGEATAVIDRHCRAEQWAAALREAERVAAMFPLEASARNLAQEVENRRAAHKKQLLDSWKDAVNRHDVEGSVEILKQLDPYLTPPEAAEIQETARRVFKDKLQLLGQQFTLAVKDHRWAEALRVGEALVAEYPNSRMASEVKEKMELLRKKAGEGAEPVKV